MKKTLISGMALLLVACACPKGNCPSENKPKEPTPVASQVSTTKEVSITEAKTESVPVVYETAAPASSVSYPCASTLKCQNQEPIVLKPRVTETVNAKNKRPCCDDDNTWLQDENTETYVPDAPEIYVIAANRAFNSMQEEAEPLFKQIGRMKVYVGDAKPLSEDLPGGMNKGMEIINKRLQQTKNVKVVNNKYVADYRIDSSADWYDTPTKTVPAIRYNITLKDRGENLIGEWSEIIHQAEGDRSWW